MKSDALVKGLMILIAILFLYVALSGPFSRTYADENMPVTCYKGSSRIGTVSVFDWKAAAATCNTVLYDCRGACIGCFRDSEYISDVCIDMSGREFLR